MQPCTQRAVRLISLSSFMAGLLLFTSALHAQAQTDEITGFTKNSNIQNNLNQQFPSGAFTAANTFHTPFSITPDSNGNNFEAIFGMGTTLTIPVHIADVTDIFTLINAYSPPYGDNLATVAFLGSAGAKQTFTLVDGTNVRDFYQGGWADTINGTTTQNAFSVTDQGGGSTGNSSTGLYGTYVIDEQHFALSAAFATQTLDEIQITNTDSSATPILLGVTATIASVPESNTLLSAVLLLAGGCLIFGRRK